MLKPFYIDRIFINIFSDTARVEGHVNSTESTAQMSFSANMDEAETKELRELLEKVEARLIVKAKESGRVLVAGT